MSVIMESQAGDELICIISFIGAPQGTQLSRETARKFRVGERVRYVGYRNDRHEIDQPWDWMVTFDAADGKRYQATQTLLVTDECWQGLKRFFARRLLREPRRLQSALPEPAQAGSQDSHIA